MKFKKIVASVLAVSTVFTMGLATACKKEVAGTTKEDQAFMKDLGEISETYEGGVSAAQFKTSKDAANAYVAEQVVGESEVEIVNTVEKGALSKKEIKKLKLPESVQTGMKGVEELEVEYSEKETGILGMATDTVSKTKKVKIYIIKYDGFFKYYTPCPVTGDTITKAYYDSVFNAEKYKNCTMTSITEQKMNMVYTYGSETTTMVVDSKVDQTIKMTEKAIYIESKVTMTAAEGGSAFAEDDEMTMYAYVEKTTTNDIKCYVKIGADSTEWIEGELETIGFDSLEDLAPFEDQYLDYTYFTKTDYGFELSEENAAKYVSATLDAVGELGAASLGTGMNMEIFAKYFVCEGVLSGMRMDMDMTVNYSYEGMSMQGSSSAFSEIKVVDYGKTVVEKPFTE